MEPQIKNFFERQYLTMFNLTIIIAWALLLGMCYFLASDEKTIVIVALVSLILLLFFFLFYKMEFRFSREELTVKFGIGLIKWHWETKNLDIKAAKFTCIPWYNGIGIRILKDGVLYNAHSGNAIAIYNKVKNRYIYIGTKRKVDLQKYFDQV